MSPLRQLVLATSLVLGATANERPNVILVMADDMGWGDPSYNNGWIDTPALDAMAAEGLRFDRFYSASAVCSPTRGSCLTGRHPLRLGITNANAGRLEADETPLSEILDGVGYATGHFGKWHLGTLTTLRKDSNRGANGNTSVYSPPWQHQYDDSFATEAKVPTFHPMRRAVNSLPEPTSFTDPNFYGTYYWTPPANLNAAEGIPVDVTDNLSGDDSRVIMDRAIPFIQDAVTDGDPFFTVIWFHTPHKPVTDPDGVSNVDSTEAYTDAIVNMDTQIARLRAELDTLGVSQDTMLWFCSDNGPENGIGSPGPFRERKRSLHEGGVRVPGVLVWPSKIPSGRVTDFPSVTSDYYPTIVDYLCLEVPNQKPLDGISLRGVIENTATVRTQPIGFNYLSSRSWVNQQYKLISKDNGNSFELYDLLNDSSEQSNIAGSNPGIVSQMTAEFQSWSTAVATDTEYLPPIPQVTVALTTAENIVSKSFEVSILFSEEVTGLELEDFVISNGLASTLTGEVASYTLTVTPTENGLTMINLPSGSAIGLDETPNTASNILTVQFGTPSSVDRDILIDDHFEDDFVANWISQGNRIGAIHNIIEAGSLLQSEVLATAGNTNRGIASTVPFDPLESSGFSLTFVVDSLAQTPEVNGLFLGIVGDNSVFYRDGTTRNFGLTFFGIDARTNSTGGFGLNFGDNFGPTGAEMRLHSDDLQLASLQDGFTATIAANPLGWQLEISEVQDFGGTPTVFEQDGSWTDSGTTFDTLFENDSSWFVVTSNQKLATGSHRVDFDRIRLVGGGELPPEIVEISKQAEQGGVRIIWKTIEGRRYRIERSFNLESWTEIGEITATQNTATFEDPAMEGVDSLRFYRIRLL